VPELDERPPETAEDDCGVDVEETATDLVFEFVPPLATPDGELLPAATLLTFVDFVVGGT